MKGKATGITVVKSQNHDIPIKCWKEMMTNLWKQTWDVVPDKKEQSDVEGEVVYDVGYWYSRGGNQEALWNSIFTLRPVLRKVRIKTIGKSRRVSKLEWNVETYVEHHGQWNPRDGGDPPCMEEVDLGNFPSFLKALGRIAYFEIDCALMNLGEHVMEEEMAKQEQEEYKTCSCCGRDAHIGSCIKEA